VLLFWLLVDGCLLMDKVVLEMLQHLLPLGRSKNLFLFPINGVAGSEV